MFAQYLRRPAQFLAALVIGFAGLTFFHGSAQALSCTGTDTPGSQSRIFFDHTANTCAIGDDFTYDSSLFGIWFFKDPTASPDNYYAVKDDTAGAGNAEPVESFIVNGVAGSVISDFLRVSQDFEAGTYVATIMADLFGTVYTMVINFSTDGGSNIDILSAMVTAVPLPAALPLIATALGGLGLIGWRRKRLARAA